MQYTANAVTVEAIQWDGTEESQREIVNWTGGVVEGMFSDHAILHVWSSDGMQVAEPGDWVVQDIDGEFHRYKPAMFTAKFGDAYPQVPAAQVRALVTLLYPDEMTPVAKRQFDKLTDPD